MARRRAESAAITRASTKAFEDLGCPDAAGRQAKLRLAYALNQVLEERQLSRSDVPSWCESRSRRSLRCVTTRWRFSVERLMNVLPALGQDVEIVIRRKPRSRRAARISVLAA